MDIRRIDLREVFIKYFGYTNGDFVEEGGGIYYAVCEFHNDEHPSMKLYNKEGVWDFYCYVCKTGGNAVTALVKGNKAKDEDEAVEMLMRDFDLVLPSYVDVENFAKLKGFEALFLSDQGIQNKGDFMEIPFYDENMDIKAKKVRTKYQGKNKYYYDNSIEDGDNTSYYGLHKLNSYPDDVIYFCEGETDALTLIQNGYPAVGIPSTNAWKDAKAHLFAKFNRIVVVRDSDTAGNNLVQDVAKSFPDKTFFISLPHRVKDINNFWNYTCNCDKDKFTKMFDGFLRKPATPEAFKTGLIAEEYKAFDVAMWDYIVQNMKSDTEALIFREEVAKLAKVPIKIINSAYKEAKNAEEEVLLIGGSNVYEYDNCYYKRITKGGVEFEKKISNFVIRLHSVIDEGDKQLRKVRLTNDIGQLSSPIELDGKLLTNPLAFSEKCLDLGNFLYQGTAQDLIEINKLIIEATKSAQIIKAPRKIGKVGNVWLFGNCGVDSKGEIVPANEDGVVTIDGQCYLPTSNEEGEEEGINKNLPVLKLAGNASFDIEKFKREIAIKLLKAYGTHAVWYGLGWAVAGYYSDYVFKKYELYPHLFIFGKRNSGKTTLARYLFSSFGYNGNYAGMSIESSSNVSITRNLGFNASLPQWYDDYKNASKKAKQKDGLLLDVYNRHGSAKGIVNSTNIRREKINGFLLISGEDRPENNAIQTRCVVIEVSANRNDAESFKAVQPILPDLHYAGVQWCRNSMNADNHTKLFEKIEEIKKLIQATGVDERLATNKAVFAGAFLLEFESVLSKAEIEEFLTYICTDTKEEKKQIEDDHSSTVFLNDLGSMIFKGVLIQNADYFINDDKFYFHWSSVFLSWSNYNRKGAELFTEQTLKGYIKQEGAYIKECRPRFANRRVMTELDIEKLKGIAEDLYATIQWKIDEAEKTQPESEY